MRSLLLIDHNHMQKLLTYLKKHPHATYAAIARHMGWAARNTALYHTDRLIRAGKLHRKKTVVTWEVV